MYSKFFNGFLILFFPDGIFKRAIKEEEAFKPLMSLLISAAVFSSIGLYGLKHFTVFKIQLSFTQALLLILSIFFMLILVTAALSGFLNWMYFMTLKNKNKRLETDFLNNFCAHTYVVPIWGFLIFLHIVFTELHSNIAVIIISVFLVIRLLDIEARLVKSVYKLRLIQGYMLIFIQTSLLFIGGIIGWMLSIQG